jgi:hypothetical protein
MRRATAAGTKCPFAGVSGHRLPSDSGMSMTVHPLPTSRLFGNLWGDWVDDLTEEEKDSVLVQPAR